MDRADHPRANGNERTRPHAHASPPEYISYDNRSRYRRDNSDSGDEPGPDYRDEEAQNLGQHRSPRIYFYYRRPRYTYRNLREHSHGDRSEHPNQHPTIQHSQVLWKERRRPWDDRRHQPKQHWLRHASPKERVRAFIENVVDNTEGPKHRSPVTRRLLDAWIPKEMVLHAGVGIFDGDDNAGMRQPPDSAVVPEGHSVHGEEIERIHVHEKERIVVREPAPGMEQVRHPMGRPRYVVRAHRDQRRHGLNRHPHAIVVEDGSHGAQRQATGEHGRRERRQDNPAGEDGTRVHRIGSRTHLRGGGPAARGRRYYLRGWHDHPQKKDCDIPIHLYHLSKGKVVCDGRHIPYVLDSWSDARFIRELKKKYRYNEPWWHFKSIKYIYIVSTYKHWNGGLMVHYDELMEYQGPKSISRFKYLLDQERNDNDWTKKLDELITKLLQKRRESSTVCVEIVEQLNWLMLMCLLVLAIVFSTITGVSYAIVRKDVGGGFGIASFEITCFSLVLAFAALSSYLGLNKIVDDELYEKKPHDGEIVEEVLEN